MASTRLFPKDFLRHKQLKEKLNYLDDSVLRRLQRFPYRYRFAKSFRQIEADTEIKTRTLIGYEAGMKVFLAYTCYEQIVYVANNLKVDGVNSKAFNEVLNENIIICLHKNKTFMKLITEAYESGLVEETETKINKAKNNTTLSISLEKFINNKSSDILCLAYAIRNLYAHGEFTGGGAGITNNKTRDLFYQIAEEILNYSNSLYSQCISKINLKR
ncbi:MAG: hypothetical protein F2678_07095 [Actinobacteria bacterium]|nr:hypothetical protein [Actinomycetota bacterium]